MAQLGRLEQRGAEDTNASSVLFESDKVILKSVLGPVDPLVTVVLRVIDANSIPLPAEIVSYGHAFNFQANGAPKGVPGLPASPQPVKIDVLLSSDDLEIVGGLESNIVIQRYLDAEA